MVGADQVDRVDGCVRVVSLGRCAGRHLVLDIALPGVDTFLHWLTSRRRFATAGASGKSARFWTAPVLWRFGRACEMDDGRSLYSGSARSGGKAVEDYRSPRRFATTVASGKSARFWTAPVPWRFGRACEMDDGRSLYSGSARSGGKAVEDYRSPRRFATTVASGKSARFWTAPVLWRFGRACEMDDGRSLYSGSARSGGKAVEDYRSPRRFATAGASGKFRRFWTAPVLWRFGRGCEMDDGRSLYSGSARSGGKAVEDYRSPRRFATTGASGRSAMFWTARLL